MTALKIDFAKAVAKAVAFDFYGYLRMRLLSYLASATDILNLYQGEMPFAAWLKNHFRQHKKFGSRDRKIIADLCFCFFRTGSAFSELSVHDRILSGQFLCHTESRFIVELKPDWSERIKAAPADKMAFLKEEPTSVFPWINYVNPAINKEAFALSFLHQPDLFLRIRPGKEKAVVQKLHAAGVPFLQDGDCLRLSNCTAVDDVLRIDEEVVVQDRSSQRVLEPLQEHFTKTKFTVWDCCAASGGKTILLHDKHPQATITVSDIRESIIINLKNRLKRAGLNGYRSLVADVASPHFSLQQAFDLVICDAPCSGSGTWARTPEQLSFFPEEKIDYYAGLQKRIAVNASRHLTKGGAFLYVTCSVFTRENEDVVAYIEENTGLQLLTKKYFTGYTERGDTLFAALFTA